ncbi:MAG: hypothetical protein K6G10_06735 [Butyrivibrio sp.]|nr:hypothetical protein [Butyrivibrio sp.]
MNIKTFRDGDRLVIVVEGLKNIPSDEILLSKFVSGIMGSEAESFPEAEASPIPIMEEADKGIFVKTSFYEGLLDSAYPFVDSFKKESELLSSLGENAEVYLRHKFSKMDANGYAGRLNDAQKAAFFQRYGKYLYQPLVEDGDVAKAIEYYQY